ncbi:4'-phosphopantetheinyl transferase superfamily protein [Trichocoleus desertorum AS-A10]|uniref:4'-phosphopantetheinyl transferase family protein n=1 Tax=Trichocoleus desertorum TaxID=1481672 RepID=UPI003298012F
MQRIADNYWQLPPADLKLAQDEVHVWCADLDQDPTLVEQFHETLTSDEQERAAKFYFPKDRQHFIMARGLLRLILGRYLDQAPAHLRFVYNAYGKPSLEASPSLHFNLSHSKGLALLGVSSDRELGIDLEYIRTDFPVDQVAKSVFSVSEQNILRSLPDALKPEAFFNAWTRKEAYIKGLGQGLSIPLDQFDVAFVPSEPATLREVRGTWENAHNWTLQHLTPVPNYVAAIAVAGSGWQLKAWRWLNG